MVARRVKKLAEARKGLTELTPAQLAEVSGGGGFPFRRHHHRHHHHHHRHHRHFPFI
jgi:hypothetical protein